MTKKQNVREIIINDFLSLTLNFWIKNAPIEKYNAKFIM